jgi:hypothetical protein
LLLTIALGVGSNSSVYGFLQGLIHPASLLGGSDRVVSLFRQDRVRGAGPLSRNDYQLLQRSIGAFDWIGAVRIKRSSITIGTHREITTVAAATPNLAETLRTPSDEGAVISHRLWESEFGGGANAVGSQIRIDNVDYRIKGVAPDHLDGLYNDRTVDLWVPLQERDMQGDDREPAGVLGSCTPSPRHFNASGADRSKFRPRRSSPNEHSPIHRCRAEYGPGIVARRGVSGVRCWSCILHRLYQRRFAPPRTSFEAIP